MRANIYLLRHKSRGIDWWLNEEWIGFLSEELSFCILLSSIPSLFSSRIEYLVTKPLAPDLYFIQACFQIQLPHQVLHSRQYDLQRMFQQGLRSRCVNDYIRTSTQISTLSFSLLMLPEGRGTLGTALWVHYRSDICIGTNKPPSFYTIDCRSRESKWKGRNGTGWENGRKRRNWSAKCLSHSSNMRPACKSGFQRRRYTHAMLSTDCCRLRVLQLHHKQSLCVLPTLTSLSCFFPILVSLDMTIISVDLLVTHDKKRAGKEIDSIDSQV